MKSAVVFAVTGFAASIFTVPASAAIVFSESFGTLNNDTVIASSTSVGAPAATLDDFTLARKANNANATFTAKNPSAIGSGASGLMSFGASTGSVSALLAPDAFTSADVLSGGFTLRTTSTSGTWQFRFGDGSSFANSNGYQANETFFILQGSSATLSYRNGSVSTNLTGVTLAANTTYRFDVVVNRSGATIPVTGGSQATLGDDRALIYVNGTLAGDVVIGTSGASGQAGDFLGTADSVAFNASSTGTIAFEVDDFVVYNTAQVPEPTSIGFVAVAGAALSRRRR